MEQKNLRIVTTKNKKGERELRDRVPDLDFDKEDKKELRGLVRFMRRKMKEAEGIGLSANQIGLKKRFFVAETPDQNGNPKFYAVFNPKIVKPSSEKELAEEGCLSAPRVFGPVERPSQVTLEGFNVEGKKLKIKAWGLLARVFQHEVDHLDGVLFLDKAKEVREVEPGHKPDGAEL